MAEHLIVIIATVIDVVLLRDALILAAVLLRLISGLYTVPEVLLPLLLLRKHFLRIEQIGELLIRRRFLSAFRRVL